jgi:glucokinase
MRASTPRRRSAAGSEALTSPNPPVFTSGVHSGVTKRTEIGLESGTEEGNVILAGDVGGTKILLEAGEFTSGRWRPVIARRYALAEYAGMEEVLGEFLEEWERDRPPRARLTGAAIGVAGPCIGNCVTMTNRPWRLDGGKLASRFGLRDLTLLNDLEASAHGLAAIPPRDFVTWQEGKPVKHGNRVLLGVGTGLGVAYLVANRAGAGHMPGPGFSVVAGEGGHVGFSPATPPQLELWKRIYDRHARVEAEHVVCGGALDRDGVEMFSANLGNVAGDQALNVMATGGVFICGGVIARIGPSIKKDVFSAAFAAKGAHSSILKRVPVRAIVNEKLALIGAAVVACS